MPRFLSSEWIASLDRAVQHAALSHTDDAPLVLEQVVTGLPEGDVAYHLVVGGPGTGVREGHAAQASVRITVPFDTAQRISAGEESAQAAFMTGRLRIGGDIDSLLRHRELLAGLDDVFAAVRAETVYF